MNITIEIVHKYIIKVHNIVLIILVCKWHLFFRILRTQKMVKILTFINQERQRECSKNTKWTFPETFLRNGRFLQNSFRYAIKVKCQEWMDYCMRFLTRAFATKDAFVNLVVQHTLLVEQWIFEKYNSAEPAVFLDTSQTASDIRVFVRKKEKRPIQFMTNKCFASDKLNLSEKFRFNFIIKPQTRQL